MSQEHHLSDVVSVVVRNQKRLAENVLAGPVRNLRVQIGLWIFNQLLHRLQVLA